MSEHIQSSLRDERDHSGRIPWVETTSTVAPSLRDEDQAEPVRRRSILRHPLRAVRRPPSSVPFLPLPSLFPPSAVRRPPSSFPLLSLNPTLIMERKRNWDGRFPVV